MNILEFTEQMLESQDLKHSTLTTYNDVLKQYIAPTFGERELSSINKLEIDQFRKKLIASAGGSRVNIVISLLRKIFSEALENQIISHNPAAKIKFHSYERNEPQLLSRRQINRALEFVEDHYRPIITFLAMTGARPNEALALKWECVNFEKKTISVCAGRVGEVIDSPKSRAGYRDLVMCGSLAAVLQPLQKEPKDFVFLGKDGSPLNGHNLNRVWKRALEAAGIDSTGHKIYCLRHSYITHAIKSDFSLIGFVSKHAGHASIRTTLDKYTKYIRDDQEGDRAKLERLLA